MRGARRLGLYKGVVHTYNTPPSYVGKSASMASGTGNITITVPSGYQTNDLLVLLLEGHVEFAPLPSGWTNRATKYSGNATLRVCYKVSSASESSVTIGTTTDSTRGIMLCFRGVDISTPFINSANTSATGTSFSASSFTTTVNNCMVICAVGFYDDDLADTSNYSSWACASLVSITEGHDQSTTDGSGGGISFSYGVKATAGAVGNITATTDSASNYSAACVFALTPSA